MSTVPLRAPRSWAGWLALGVGVSVGVWAGVHISQRARRRTSRASPACTPGARVACNADATAAMWRAIVDGSVPGVTDALAAGGDVEACVDGERPLVAAVFAPTTAILQLLLDAGAHVDARGSGDTTALITACTVGRVDAVRALLAAGADLRLTDGAHFNAAHMAAKGGHTACLQELAGRALGVIDVARETDGATPLMLAAADNQVPAVAWLLSKRASPNARMSSGITPLMVAARADNDRVCSLLLSAGADARATSNDNRSALSVAAHHNAIHAARALLANGGGSSLAASSPDLADALPMVIAARRGHVDMIRVLAAGGEDANVELQDGRSLLLALCEAVDSVPAKRVSRMHVIQALLQAGADPHKVSRERALASSRRDSLISSRSPVAAARAAHDVELLQVLTGYPQVAGGEPTV